ncbi:MAG: C25 family cysteine peptidase [Acidobacteriota bacterium]
MSITPFSVTGSATYLVVGVSIETSTITVSGVTVGSSSLSFVGRQIKLGTSNKPPVTIEIWALVNPPTGSQTITATLSSAAKFVVGAVLFTGVDQTNPTTGFVSTSGHATPISLTVPSSTGDLVVDVYGRNDPSNTDPQDTVAQIEHLDTKTNSVSLSMSTKSGAAPTITMDWAVTGGGNDWALGAISIKSLGPTLATVNSFSAFPSKNGKVTLKWDTRYEVDNLGFNIYREQDGKLTLITPNILAGSALEAGKGIALTSGKSYVWTDKTASKITSARYWIEDIDLRGEKTLHGPVYVDSSKSSERVFSEGANELLSLREIHSQAENLQTEVDTKPVEDAMELAKFSQAKQAYNLNATSQASAKINIKSTGWYKVGQPDLIAAGFPSNVDPRKLQLYVDGRQVAMRVNGQADGKFDATDSLEFYGVALNSIETDKHAYWLVAGNEAGLRINQVKAAADNPSQTSFDYSVEIKDRFIYFSGLLNGDEENFFGSLITAYPTNKILTATNLDSGFEGNAKLEIALQGVTDLPGNEDHRVKVIVNGNPVGTLVFDGTNRSSQVFSIPQSLLTARNTVTLNSLSGGMDYTLVDFIRLTYRRTYTADADKLRMTVEANQTRQVVTGFSTDKVRVIDITNPELPTEFATTAHREGDGYGVTFGLADADTHTVLALAENRFLSPSSIKLVNKTNLRGKANQADLLIITNGNFSNALNPLVALRRSQGLRPVVVDVEDIYNEFAFGQKSTQAIKNFLSYAYSLWSTPPRYVLFVGDASYDMKNYLGFGEVDFVPSKLIDTAVFQTASDDWFADFNNEGVPVMYVGRLPGRTASEVSQMVAKLENYEKASGLSKSALMIADTNDGFNFEAGSMTVQSLLPAGTNADLVFRSRNSDDKNRTDVLSFINNGQQVVNYLGHGAISFTRGNLLSSDAVSHMENTGQFPLFVMMTCLTGYFEDALNESLAETLVKADQSGAIAVWASSAICPPDAQAEMNLELMKALFGSSQSKPLTLGEAAAKAKAATANVDVRRTWILFGDPSMKLK